METGDWDNCIVTNIVYTVHTPELVCNLSGAGADTSVVDKMVNPVFMASECGVEEAHNRLSEKDMSGLHNPNQTVVALW